MGRDLTVFAKSSPFSIRFTVGRIIECIKDRRTPIKLCQLSTTTTDTQASAIQRITFETRDNKECSCATVEKHGATKNS